MRNGFDVIVVGVGAMGSAACYQLAARGASVLGLEQFGIPNTLGSSHGESRMLRLCYFEHPDYVPLLQRACELWVRLEHDSARKLLHTTGGIYMGRPDSEFISGTLRSAVQHRLAHESLDHAQLAHRFGQFNLPKDYVGVYEPGAGLLLPERVISAHAELAMRQGAVLHGQEPVRDWQAGDDGVVVHTDRATYHADHLVVSGGAWSSRLLGDLGVELVVTRQVVGWVWPKRPELFELGALPIWAIDNPRRGQPGLLYGFPMLPETPGLKIAHHFPGEPTTPDTIDRQALPGDEDDFRPALGRFIPHADGPLLSMHVCMYTNTPDSHFIIDRHPAHDRVTLACGFSGHGFKFASVIGEALADLALTGRTDLPIEFLGLSRFG